MRATVLTVLLLSSPALARDELPELTHVPPEDVLVQLVVERLDARSGPVAVPSEYGFREGDRVRFEVHANRGGYWAVAAREAGKLVRIWPEEAGGQPVQAGRWTLVPTDARTVEDRTLRIVGGGDTELVLLFSPRPLATPETLPKETLPKETLPKETLPAPRWLRQVRLRGNVVVDKNPVPSKPVHYFHGTVAEGTIAGVEVTLRHGG